MKAAGLVSLLILMNTTAMAMQNSSVAMILRKADSPIDVSALLANVKKTLSAEITGNVLQKDGSIVFDVGPDRFVVSEMPAPVPKAEIDAALTNSMLCRDKQLVATEQKAHVIVGITTKDKTVIANRLLLTKLCEAVLKTVDSIGVYWGASSQVIDSKVFVEFAKEATDKQLPMAIWMSLTVETDPNDKTSFYSNGLEDLGYTEVEVINLKMPIVDAYYFLLDFMNYVIVSGDNIRDGDTIGRNAEEKLKVRYLPSELTDRRRVMRIEM